jgi:hypothetical protein
MAHSADPELSKLIENEIDIGFTFLQTFALAHSKEHADQALYDAQTAYQAAARLFQRIPPDSLLGLRARLENLARAVSAAQSVL